MQKILLILSALVFSASGNDSIRVLESLINTKVWYQHVPYRESQLQFIAGLSDGRTLWITYHTRTMASQPQYSAYFTYGEAKPLYELSFPEGEDAKKCWYMLEARYKSQSRKI